MDFMFRSEDVYLDRLDCSIAVERLPVVTIGGDTIDTNIRTVLVLSLYSK